MLSLGASVVLAPAVLMAAGAPAKVAAAAFVRATAVPVAAVKAVVEAAACVSLLAAAARVRVLPATKTRGLAYNVWSWKDDVFVSCYYFPPKSAVCTAG